MTYRSKNPLGLGQPGYAAERYVPTNLGQANYAAERYVPVSLGQPGYAAERYIPTNLGRAPYAMERYIPASLGQPGYAAERYVPMSGLGQPGYAAERYLPVSLGQPGYAAERYIPMAGLGQAKTGTTSAKTGTTSGSTTTAKTGTTGGEDTTARDFRTAADVGGSLIGGVVRGFTGGSTTTPATTPDMTAMTTPIETQPSGGTDWYWPVVISGGLILVGGIGYFALKGKKSAPTPNKRKRVSRNAGGTFALVRAEGMKDRVISLHKTKEAAEKAMEKKGGIPHSLFTKGMRVVDVGPNGFYEVIEVFGQKTIRPREGSWKKLAPNRKRVSRNRKPAAADPIGARELLLVTENEYSLHRQQQAIEKNLLRKLKSGKYDHAKAAKAWQYWMDAGAKLYAKQYGGSFSPATRALAASEYADLWYESYKAVMSNGYGRRAARSLKGKRRSRSKRTSRR
jgi:hypothetical protein